MCLHHLTYFVKRLSAELSFCYGPGSGAGMGNLQISRIQISEKKYQSETLVRGLLRCLYESPLRSHVILVRRRLSESKLERSSCQFYTHTSYIRVGLDIGFFGRIPDNLASRRIVRSGFPVVVGYRISCQISMILPRNEM